MNGHNEPTSDSLRRVLEEVLSAPVWLSGARAPDADSANPGSSNPKGRHKPVPSQRTKSRRVGFAIELLFFARSVQSMRRAVAFGVFITRAAWAGLMKSSAH